MSLTIVDIPARRKALTPMAFPQYFYRKMGTDMADNKQISISLDQRQASILDKLAKLYGVCADEVIKNIMEEKAKDYGLIESRGMQ